MANFQQHLAEAITGAERLACLTRTISDAMEDCEQSWVKDYRASLDLLEQSINAHTLSLEALQMADGWATTAQQKTVFSLDAELLDARVLVERVRVLLRIVCEDYFNEQTNNPNTAKGQQGILGGFDENRVICWSANACVVELDKAIGNMAAVMSAAKAEGVKSA